MTTRSARSSTTLPARRSDASKASLDPCPAPGPKPMRHVVIENVSPSVDGGAWPVKRVVGERCVVEADVFRDGHDKLRAVMLWRADGEADFEEVEMEHVVNDRWRGSFPLTENRRYRFTVQAWTDHFASWAADLKKRVDARQADVRSEILEGIARIDEAAARAGAPERTALDRQRRRLADAGGSPAAALAAAEAPELRELMRRLDSRADLAAIGLEFEVVADRPRAAFGAWYEMFVRSQGIVEGRSGTFADAARRLPDIAAMGFDVVYLAPIHPIGRTNRKGRNNSLKAAPSDPGSPWAIGSPDGGHDAIEPALGTLDDFDRFVAAARRLDMEIALDLALQCSPDHPWVAAHPDWFFHRPDGTIKSAENPPKKYEDIYPIDFDTQDRVALWNEVERVVLHWIGHGVRIFRVDNPHTKPVAFWAWLIRRIQEAHPDVLLLSEAFTRPKMMKALAKAGFSQSYTYFTWRNLKWELTQYLTELTTDGMLDVFRPNFFANTPDILHEFLQLGGPAAFRIRLVLAATLSPAYGIYSGFELCENEARPGTEEYQDSEKYEIRVRDWDRPGNIKELVARVNALRRENRALQALSGLSFLEASDDDILCFLKSTADRDNQILVAVNLDPKEAHHCHVHVPLEELGLEPGDRFVAHDLLTGARYDWGGTNYVRLDPQGLPAHILRVEASGR